MMQRVQRVLAMAAIGLAVMVTVADVAEARRAGGGFGSRGSRTFSMPPTTRTAPTNAAPIERTMTPQPAPSAATRPAAQGQTTASRPGLFGGFGGSMLGGLMMGGLIGMLLGHGLGGGIGFLGLLLQVGLIVAAIALAKRFFGRSSQPAYSAPSAAARNYAAASAAPSFRIPRIGEGLGGGPAAASANRPSPSAKSAWDNDEIGIGQGDLDQFEAILKQLQAAYAAEDYAALRRLTTPEAMSYLAEELSENATKGLKNDVRDVHLVEGDVAEAWHENGTDYATVAMRYESIDVMRERATGRVVSGDPERPTDAVELWTFLRRRGADWQVSAIQAVEA
ncbi:putative transmembrane protein [Sinorhizobium alkalisoli]|nr:putative transmembrane protein [Sinorhizobium alkalisoli]